MIAHDYGAMIAHCLTQPCMTALHLTYHLRSRHFIGLCKSLTKLCGVYLRSDLVFRASINPWAARYTGLLIKLTPKGVVFSLFLSIQSIKESRDADPEDDDQGVMCVTRRDTDNVCSRRRMMMKKKKDFTSFCQPTQPIACANHGNHVQIIMKSRQSTT